MSWKRWFFWILGGAVIGGVFGAVLVFLLSAISSGPCSPNNAYTPWWVDYFICPSLLSLHDIFVFPVEFAAALFGFLPPFGGQIDRIEDALATRWWSFFGVLMGTLFGAFVGYLKIAKEHSSPRR